MDDMIFALGYDLLNADLIEMGIGWENALKICKLFYDKFESSSYNERTKSEYQCLIDFVDDCKDDVIDEILSGLCDDYYLD